MRLDTLPDDLAGLTVGPLPKRAHFECLDGFDGPPKPALLEDYVRAELARDEGCAAHRAWLERAAARLHLVPT